MKKFIIVLTLILSANTFAAEVFLPSAITAVAAVTVGATRLINSRQHKEAAEIIDDAQAFNESGTISLFLSQKIQELQAINPELSNSEALDLLLFNSQKILNQ